LERLLDFQIGAVFVILRDRIEEKFISICSDLGLDGSAITSPAVVVSKPGDSKLPAFHFNSDIPFYPACMIKVPLAAALYAMFDRGIFSPDDVVEVQSGDVTETAAPTPYVAGKKDTLRNYVHHALRFSDNIATNVLLEVVDRHLATAILRDYGLHQTKIARKLGGKDPVADVNAIGRNQHSARDAAALFTLIYEQSIPGAQQMGESMRFVSTTSPGEVMIKKTGYTSQVNHMAGAWHLPDAGWFVYALFTNMPSDEQSNMKICDFMDRLRPILLEWRS
jgi:Beta-lactamase enzyme family